MLPTTGNNFFLQNFIVYDDKCALREVVDIFKKSGWAFGALHGVFAGGFKLNNTCSSCSVVCVPYTGYAGRRR